MLKVHHLDNSRSQRILWLVEELGIEYELVKHQRDPVTVRSPKTLYAVHPLGKGPAIEHDGRAMTESGAIIDYITRKVAGGQLARDESSDEFMDYCFWLHYAEASVMGPVQFDLLDGLTGYACGDALKGFYMSEMKKHFDYASSVLARQDFVLKAGFSAADINLAWVLELAEPCGTLADQPVLSAYLQRMRARPAYIRSIEVGGEQDLCVFRPKEPVPLTR